MPESLCDNPLERLRALCLALPEATEQLFAGHDTPTFRVRGKIFAMFSHDEHGDGRAAVWCKAPPGAREVLVGAAPDRFFSPPYLGPKGWIGIRLNASTDWEELAGLAEDSYRMIAPKRLAARLDGPAAAPAAHGRPARAARAGRVR
jgi:predicted DNA-binding protein (MmcQ/YjbR family)